MLKDLIISRVRVKMLEFFFQNPGKIFHVRDIVRKLSEEINAVRREFAHLEKIGLFYKERRANRLFYGLRKDHVLYNDLLYLIAKTGSMGSAIIKNRLKLGKIKFAMMSGKLARQMPRAHNEVDLLFVGKLVLPEINQIIRQEELRIGREINYTVMSEEEFEFRKKRKDPFILDILKGSRIMLIGDEIELLK